VKDPASHRAAVMSDFNNPEENIQVLIASNLTLATGVNLDKACWTGISLCLSTNAKQQGQICKCIHRITSTRPVTWHYIKVKDTFNDSQERLACQKWVQQMSAECALDSWLPDETREICLFEAIRTKWHQKFNHYAWEVARSVDAKQQNQICKRIHRITSKKPVIWHYMTGTADISTRTACPGSPCQPVCSVIRDA
jgi:hypothetical protein